MKPIKIVFADDKKKHVDELERVLGSGPIPYIGFRYGGPMNG
jgi:predicted phosphatase